MSGPPAKPPTPLTALRLALALSALAACTPQFAHADIFRWDNGQLIPGTAGLTPAPGVNLASLNLQYASLASDHLATASFQSSDLTAAKLLSTDLTSANLSSANLTSANLFNTKLSSADFSGAVLQFTNLAFGQGFTSAQLYSTASYQAHDLTGLALSGGSGWDFSSQNLTSADFQSAHLASASFVSANLTSANFFNADMTSVDFTGATVRGASFQFIPGFLGGPGPSASQIYSTASYQAHDLSGITLSNAAGWNLSSQNLSSAYLAFVDFTSANLASANLTSANLQYALFTSADLTGAIVRGVQLTYATGLTAAQFYSTASYQNHNLIGIALPDATGWDLSQQDLSSAQLASVQLSSANLADSTLFKANLTSANLTSANLTGADLRSANLANANLTSANFSLADLRATLNFTPAASTLVRGIIGSNGTVQPFPLLPGDDFRIRAGTPVIFAGTVTFSTNTALVIDAGATVQGSATLDVPVAAALQVQGHLTVPNIAVTLDGGTLSGYGTITGVVNAGIVPHKIAPSSGLPPTSTGALTASALATNTNTTLAFNLITPGPASINDQLIITAPAGLSLSGGNIQIANTSTGKNSLGYYKLIQYTGSIQGTGISSLTLPAESNNIAYILDTTHDPGYIDLHRGFLGDSNDDGIVNAIDLGILATNYNSTTANWSEGDYNGDGIVNAIDLGILATNYNAVIGAGTDFASAIDAYPVLESAYNASSVPEPATLLMLSCASFLALARRRKR